MGKMSVMILKSNLMKRYYRGLALCLIAVVVMSNAATHVLADDAASQSGKVNGFRHKIEAFFQRHCLDCHGDKEPEGDFSLVKLGYDPSVSRDVAKQWQKVSQKLILGEMPPEKAKQPKTSEIRAIVNWATEELKRAHAARKSDAGKTVLRRLNREEYDRTVRHLLSLEDMLADPTDVFPPDETEENFNNIGSALITSDFLMKHYLG